METWDGVFGRWGGFGHAARTNFATPAFVHPVEGLDCHRDFSRAYRGGKTQRHRLIFFSQKIVITSGLAALSAPLSFTTSMMDRKGTKSWPNLGKGVGRALCKRGSIPSRAKRGGIPGVLRSEQAYPPPDWRGLHSRIAQFSLRRVAAFPKPNRIVEASSKSVAASNWRNSGSVRCRPPVNSSMV